jgi:hypothetical protein
MAWPASLPTVVAVEILVVVAAASLVVAVVWTWFSHFFSRFLRLLDK